MLNRFVCIGRLSKELELKKTPNGKSVCSTTIAVNRNYKDQSGETKADFFPVVIWGSAAERTVQYCNKGSLVGIDGRMETRSYEGQNGRVYLTEIIAESVQFLDSKPQNEQSNFGRTAAQSMYAQSQANSYDPFQNMNGKLDISESDLPF